MKFLKCLNNMNIVDIPSSRTHECWPTCILVSFALLLLKKTNFRKFKRWTWKKYKYIMRSLRNLNINSLHFIKIQIHDNKVLFWNKSVFLTIYKPVSLARDLNNLVYLSLPWPTHNSLYSQYIGPTSVGQGIGYTTCVPQPSFVSSFPEPDILLHVYVYYKMSANKTTL